MKTWQEEVAEKGHNCSSEGRGAGGLQQVGTLEPMQGRGYWGRHGHGWAGVVGGVSPLGTLLAVGAWM